MHIELLLGPPAAHSIDENRLINIGSSMIVDGLDIKLGIGPVISREQTDPSQLRTRKRSASRLTVTPQAAEPGPGRGLPLRSPSARSHSERRSGCEETRT